MAKEKRTKPCSNCKRSKVKCEYTENLPCVRCVKLGFASTCQFVPKLPSLKLPHIEQANVPPFQVVPPIPASAPTKPFYHSSQQPPQQHHSHHNNSLLSAQLPGQHPGPPPPQVHNNGSGHVFYPISVSSSNHPAPQYERSPHLPPHSEVPQNQQNPSDSQWKSEMENKMNAFGSKFDDLMQALKANQSALATEREMNQRYLAHYGAVIQSIQSNQQTRTTSPDTIESIGDKRSAESSSSNKRQKHDRLDFRNTVITIDEAKLLFQFFDAHISQQLFGFEINKFSVDNIWDSSPILICAICTIAAMYYPDEQISAKSASLQSHLHELCSGLLFKGKPRTEVEGFNTIVALVLCSFWLADSQRFTGLAIQLAVEFGLNKPPRRGKEMALSEKDRLKLWYLLYALDGQQSMTLNRQSLFDSSDYSIKHSRELLLAPRAKLKGSDDSDKLPYTEDDSKAVTKINKDEQEASPSHSLTDLRLVSQVEYNQAVHEAFRGNAWDLIAPSAFGIPSKSNLELDKWMVSWTVLLAPMNNGAVWSSKSTLIYYNFAKMHINCTVMRELQVDTGDEHVVFPKWENLDQALAQSSRRQLPALPVEKDENSSDDSDDEDEFIQNTELVKQDESLLSLNIAKNSAKTVLNLALNDRDIVENLKYVPLHIHIMLYYAALLLVNPPPTNTSKIEEIKQSSYFENVISSLGTAKNLQSKIYNNLPTDKSFGNRFIKSLDEVIIERAKKLETEMADADLSEESRENIISQIHSLCKPDTFTEHTTSERSSRESSPRPERISAWPGSHHGHP